MVTQGTYGGKNGETEEAGLDIVPVVGELLGNNVHPCGCSFRAGGLVGRQGGVHHLGK